MCLHFAAPGRLTSHSKDFDKKLSHVNRGAAATKPVDGAGGAAGLDTMAEDFEAILDIHSAPSAYFCMLALEIHDMPLLPVMWPGSGPAEIRRRRAEGFAR